MRFALLLLIQASSHDGLGRFEKSVTEANSLSLSFRGERNLAAGGKSTWSGTLKLSGSRYVLVVAHNLHGEDRVETLRCDGTRTVLVVRDQARELKTGPDAARLHRAAVTRSGFFLEIRPLRDALDGRRVDENVFSVSAHRDSRAKLGDRECTVVEYALAYGSETCNVRLWLDAKTLVPVRRDAGEWTETYSDYSTAPIPDKHFQID